MIRIKLTDRDLVRRYGNKIIRIDEGMARTLIKDKRGYEVDSEGVSIEEKRNLMSNYFDKMMKFAPVDKTFKDCIFPEFCETWFLLIRERM